MKTLKYQMLAIAAAFVVSCSEKTTPEPKYGVGESIGERTHAVVSVAKPVPPRIVTEPKDVAASPGQEVVFDVEVRSQPATYQWFHNGKAVAGATDHLLKLKNATITDTGDYHLVVRGEAETPAVSRKATILLYSSPSPAIRVDQVGSSYLRGTVQGVVPSNYGILTYIRVFGGWWSKPTFNAPMTPILRNGAFSVATVTGGYDLSAGEVRLFLVPTDTPPYLSDGGGSLPAIMGRAAVAEAQVVKEPQTIVAPAILRQPVGGEVAPGARVILAVSAHGTDLQYEWQHNGKPVPGENRSNLVLEAVEPTVAGQYRVRISNPAAQVLSDPVSVSSVPNASR
jgi:hypothetical protein